MRRRDWPLHVAQQTLGLLRGILDWIGRHELVVLLAMLVLVSAVWGFVVLADEVVEGETQKFDDWAIRILRDPENLAVARGPSWLGEVGRDLTALGGVAVLSLLTAAVVGFLWLRRAYGAMWLVLASTFGGLLFSTLLKHTFDRARPDLVPHLSRVYTSSFPSGHSLLSATVYLTLGALLARVVTEWRLRAYFLIVAVVLTVLVGASRVFMGVHYPTDVLAGWTAGLAWATGCWLVARYLQKRGAVEKTVERIPADAKKEVDAKKDTAPAAERPTP